MEPRVVSPHVALDWLATSRPPASASAAGHAQPQPAPLHRRSACKRAAPGRHGQILKRWRSPPARPLLSPEHEPLVSDLAALPAPVRAAVVAQAERLAKRKAASWESVDALGGVVSLGGDALRDTDDLYDG